ncbi:MAG: hypothetical protein PHP06_02905 [Clostridia bacterium]|nr:hypothetical protein [Clostridia bacterium]
MQEKDYQIKDHIRLKRKDTGYEELIADKTRYGEFISSFHNWLGFEGLNERAEHMQNISNKADQNYEGDD